MNRCHSITEAGYSNCLPHTGLDLWVIFLAGIIILLIGAAIYKLTARRQSSWPPVRHRR